MYLSDKGQQKAGTFKPTSNEKLTFLPIEEDDINSDDLPITEMTFNVIIAIVSQFYWWIFAYKSLIVWIFFSNFQTDPYIMLKDTSVKLVGNDRFEGFGIDIIDELSKLLGFKYNFILNGSDYGSPIEKGNGNGNWS